MSLNLLDLAKTAITSQVVSKASSFLGESESNTQSAFNSVIPSLIGGLINKSSDSDGAAGLFKLLTSGDHDGGILSNVAGLFGGGDASSSLLNTGGSLVSSLFGDKVGGIVDLVSSASGIGKTSSKSLLSMAAPLLMGLVGKTVKEKGLGLSGLVDLLQGQKSHIKDAVPAGFASSLGLSSFDKIGDSVLAVADKTTGAVKGAASAATGAVGSAAKGAANVAADTADAAGSGMKKLLPLLLLAAAAIAAFFLLKKCKGGDTVTPDTEVVDSLAGNTAVTVGGEDHGPAHAERRAASIAAIEGIPVSFDGLETVEETIEGTSYKVYSTQDGRKAYYSELDGVQRLKVMTGADTYSYYILQDGKWVSASSDYVLGMKGAKLHTNPALAALEGVPTDYSSLTTVDEEMDGVTYQVATLEDGRKAYFSEAGTKLKLANKKGGFFSFLFKDGKWIPTKGEKSGGLVKDVEGDVTTKVKDVKTEVQEISGPGKDSRTNK